MLRKNFLALKQKLALGLFTSFLTLGITHSVVAAPAQDPLFLTQPVRPIMMLNMSRDHQLFFKLYDDYSDLTDESGGQPDGEADTTYVHAYKYYGYFDSKKCYTYDSADSKNYYVPSRFVSDAGYCNYQGGSGEWSGNFLNWATMTRIDAVRKILYGGLRASGGDAATLTILERAFLPQDAHSFAKYYDGDDISELTPFGSDNALTTGDGTTSSGITICNTTDPSSRNNLSQNDTGAPKMKVARGNYSLWASNERWQCRWSEDHNTSNDNNSSLSGINAHSSSPSRTNQRLGGRDFSVRVSVCVSGMIDGETNNENCQAYGDNWKPKGLLQEYGATGQIHFGLLTGSYSKNKSGGVLRKPVGNMANEINAADGTFVRPTGDAKDSHYGIIQTLDSLRIYGYRFDDGTYHRGGHGNDSNGSDGCLWSRSSFADGHCSNWGNPQSEIFLESLRYLAGLSSSDEFESDDSGRLSGLNTSDWNRPITNNNYCSPLSVIQFNASTSSYDGDQLDASDINLADVAAATNAVGDAEGLHGSQYFIGRTGGTTAEGASTDDDLCTAKTLNGLADALGTCPDAPRLEGSYKIAGLAYHARKNGIPLTAVTKGSGKQTVRTYGVALAPAVPRVNVKVPGRSQTITILPACRNINNTLSTPANCALVDFKIVDQQFDVTVDGNIANTGRLYVNWEDSEQGGDFDQDMWGVINYEVTTNQVKVTTQVMAQSTGDPMGFGYVISGTTEDGFHVHSGVNNFTYGTSCTTSGNTRCTCRVNDRNSNAFNGTAGACNIDHPAAVARDKTFTVGTSSAKLLEQPLYYAAKWGGYKDNNATLTDIKSAEADTYFFATDPRQLEASLKAAFAKVADSVGSASAVATNSTRLSNDSFLYQARFNSKSWSGELLAYPFNSDTNAFDETYITTNETLRTDTINHSTRNIYTYNGTSRTQFKWEFLTETQQQLLMDADDETLGRSRVDWLRGAKVSGLRAREKSGENEYLLGDIVNSSPAYLGGTDMRYDRLPSPAGPAYRTYLNTKRTSENFARVFVGANDGMLHAFDAATLDEKFAYVPAGVYPKLAGITKPNYGMGGEENAHQYLVDGPVAVGDAYLNGSWRSVVVGTLGAGGKGIFALDVTDPSSPPQVLFELNNNIQHLGYVMKQPYIVPLKDGEGIRWAVVFGNGYEAGSSALLWVDLESGEVNTIVAPEGQGLSAPALLPNGVGVVEAAYAGDLSGNLWKFDLSSTDDDDWSATLLFSAKTSGANPVAQPITATPTLGRNALKNNAVMVYFGTGQYLYHDDNNSNIPSQSFYAIVDKSAEISGKAALHQKTIVARAGGGRGINLNTVNWSNNIDGWYIDFPTAGERVTTKSLLLNDKVIFTTMIPSAIPCEYGGSSWIMEVPAVGDKYVGESILDDNIYQDFLTLNDVSFALIPEAPPGDDDENPDEAETPQQCGEGEYPGKIFVAGSAGTVTSEDACLSKGSLGRMSWRQLR